MYWENLVFDAAAPHEHGVFWEELLRGETLSDNSGGFETRLVFSDERYLDLCFPTVEETSGSHQRFFPIVIESAHEDYMKSVSYTGSRKKLQDVAGRDYFVLKPGDGSGQFRLAAVEIHSAHPQRDAEFWSNLTGLSATSKAPNILAHPGGDGPQLVIVQEAHQKTTEKSSVHLDLRLGAEDDMNLILEQIRVGGGQELEHGWGTLPWRVFEDPSGNEFCILP